MLASVLEALQVTAWLATADGCDGTGDECPCNYECHGGESATDVKGK